MLKTGTDVTSTATGNNMSTMTVKTLLSLDAVKVASMLAELFI